MWTTYKEMNYVTLDDVILRNQAIEDSKLFLEEHPSPLLIDEAQYAPELFPYIKMKVDTCEDFGQYWITGSQQFHLMKNVTESLAGRVGIIYLNSFTYAEIVKSYNSNGIRPNISYYRDKEKREIDLIFYKNNKLYPFEIKKTASPNKSMIKNFDDLKQTKKDIGPGGIICFYDKLMHLDEINMVIPISSVINGGYNE